MIGSDCPFSNSSLNGSSRDCSDSDLWSLLLGIECFRLPSPNLSVSYTLDSSILPLYRLDAMMLGLLILPGGNLVPCDDRIDGLRRDRAFWRRIADSWAVSTKSSLKWTLFVGEFGWDPPADSSNKSSSETFGRNLGSRRRLEGGSRVPLLSDTVAYCQPLVACYWRHLFPPGSGSSSSELSLSCPLMSYAGGAIVGALFRAAKLFLLNKFQMETLPASSPWRLSPSSILEVAPLLMFQQCCG